MKKYIGERIRKARKNKGLTLKEAAQKSNTNFSSLSKVERGEYEASYELLEKLSELYGVKVSYFFGEKMEIPQELLDLGGKEIRVAEEIRKGKKLTNEELEQIINFIKFIKSNDSAH